MRIMPLHNIREPGLIPNGFQKEEASPPAPDPRMQPDMRNRTAPQTDTRHAIEFLNPRARLETNDINRTKNADPPRIEMGREDQQAQTGRTEEKSPEANDAYERLLRILLGHKSSAGQRVSAEMDRPAKEKPLEMEGVGNTGSRKIEAYHQAATVNNPVNDGNKTMPTYYQRKGIEAYRSIQNLTPEGNVQHKA